MGLLPLLALLRRLELAEDRSLREHIGSHLLQEYLENEICEDLGLLLFKHLATLPNKK